MKQSVIVSSIFILCFLSRCNLFDNESDSAYLESLDGNLLFSITYDSSQIINSYSGFLLLLKTEKIYTNFNYPIVTKKVINSSQIFIAVKGIQKNLEIVLPAEGPARASIPLHLNQGEFELIFQNKSIIDKYSVIFTELSIAVNPIEVNFTKYIVND